MSVEVKVDKKRKKLCVEIDLIDDPQPSKKSGKTLIISTTSGITRTTQEYMGGKISIGFNAFIPNPDYQG